jgi:hypothetical protein
MSDAPNLMEAALQYADELGWYVFPLADGGKVPRAGSNGLLDATRDPEQIKRWWAAHPRANIGVNCGKSGVGVCDVDPRHGGDASFETLRHDLGKATFDTITQTTPSGGTHYVYDANGAIIRNTESKIAPGIDTRGDGGYFVAAPSVRADSSYTWVIDEGPFDRVAATWPKELTAAIPAESPKAKTRVDDAAVIPEGKRNGALASLAGSMRHRGMAEDAIEAALLKENEAKCKPPLPESEVRAIAHSVSRYDPKAPVSERLVRDAQAASETSWTPRSAAAIAIAGVPSVQWDIDGILPTEDGPAIMFGPPGSLKTWIGLHAAGCIVTGKPFLGHFAVRRRAHALYVNFDAGSRAFDRRVARCGYPVENLLVVSPDAYDASALRKLFDQHRGAFVVLDTLSDMYAFGRGDDPALAMRHFLRALRALYHEFNASGIIIDHPHRPRDGAEHGDFYGSVQKAATARIMFNVTPLPRSEQGVERAKIACRKMSEAEPFEPFVARLDFNGEIVVATYDGTLSETGARMAGAPDVEIVEQVLAGVRDGMSRVALETRAGLSRDRVLVAVKQSPNIVARGRGKAQRYSLRESYGAPVDSADDSQNGPPESHGSSATLGVPYDPRD